MKRIFPLFFALITTHCCLVLLAGFASAQGTIPQSQYSPCDSIAIRSPADISFNETEIKLMCGDREVPGWKSVPHIQAQYVVTRALEKRGYHAPSFEVRGEKLLVEAGNITNITEMRLVKGPGFIDIEKFWKPIGRPMSKDNLDYIETWLMEQLAAEGYPCPHVALEASSSDGYINIFIDEGSQWKIEYIDFEQLPGVYGGTLRRWDAFSIGDVYDERKLRLTSRRLLQNDLLLSSNFNPKCAGKLGVVHQTTAVGKPRLTSFAVGVDTEEFAVAQFTWQHGRLLKSASPMRAGAYASYIQQKAHAAFEWYYLPFFSQHFLSVETEVSRTNERRYEQIISKTSAIPTWRGDLRDAYYELGFGPAFAYLENKRGISQDKSRISSIDSRARIRSHNHEFYEASPRSGYSVELSNSTSKLDVGSSVSASIWNFSTTSIANIGALSPPVFVGVVRTKFETTDIGDETPAEDLPPNFRHYLGGAEDLRGFGRKALPNNDLGALTTGYFGLDLRLNEVLPYKLQPFVFLDGGQIGERSFKLDDDTTFWSPGAGVRWQSPVGALKFSFGHGIIDSPRRERLAHLERWQFYFSFGETF